jgi:hypothetical protein
MDNQSNRQEEQKTPGFAGYASKRVIVVAVLIVLVVWAFSSIPESLGPDTKATEDVATETGLDSRDHDEAVHGETERPADAHSEGKEHGVTPKAGGVASHETAIQPAGSPSTAADEHETAQHTKSESQTAAGNEERTKANAHGEKPAQHGEVPQTEPHKTPNSQDAVSEPAHEDRPTGVAFVEAVIAPLNYELNERFWGWRPNDIINFTDNVNNFQLGVLEVTRRTVVLLAERISRTGSTDAFNPHLENSMNWLMVKADRYWFPAPESKYKESIRELEDYKEELLKERASFFTRTDNLIPLLSSYEDLLGSCDENLVKHKNEDGSEVSHFKADDYFFYAKGVASAMATVLDAIHHDFLKTLESRHATELLHHALESCRQASELDPILITDGDLDGIIANHRANMAAPISHARFYIGQLVKTLST